MNTAFINGGGVTSAAGFVAGVAQAAIKKPGRYDLALVYSQVPAVAAGVFTTNVFQAAPVVVCKKHLEKGQGMVRGFVVNSGCANACTGEPGLEDALSMTEAAGALVGCSGAEMLVASTGVIGVRLPMDRVLAGLKEAGKNCGVENGALAARAIMTTDTFAKEIAIQTEINGKKVTIGGMAKGSGMIHPNMATMLGFLTTDAAITPSCLQEVLQEANKDSFNMISVDGDTSTNDSLIILANGMAGNEEIKNPASPAFADFLAALRMVCAELAKMVARDGEGATKLMEVCVCGAATIEDARLGARAIVSSSLVKAALFGEDANWGRIICALGYSGASFDPALVDVYIGKLAVAQKGGGLVFDEEEARKILQEKTVPITVNLNNGENQATAWGCDLSYDYVKINADYRT